MRYEMHLLDALASIAGCSYMSDLRYLDSWQRIRLARVLESIPTDMAGLDEWNDTLVYLGRDPPEKTADAAMGQLFQTLSCSKQIWELTALKS